jgi:hypothetical protein
MLFLPLGWGAGPMGLMLWLIRLFDDDDRADQGYCPIKACHVSLTVQQLIVCIMVHCSQYKQEWQL